MPAHWACLRSNFWDSRHLVTPLLQQLTIPSCRLRTRSLKLGNKTRSWKISFFVRCWRFFNLHLVPSQHWVASSSPSLPDPCEWPRGHDGQCCSTNCQPAANLRCAADVTLLRHALTKHRSCAGQNRLTVHSHRTQTYWHSAEELCSLWYRSSKWVIHCNKPKISRILKIPQVYNYVYLLP